MLAVIAIFAALLGGALGSFAGVVTSRGWRESLAGRSHCDSCERTLRWFEVVPFVSYVALRGRCRTCGMSIGPGPFLWELGGGAVALAIAMSLVVVTAR